MCVLKSAVRPSPLLNARNNPVLGMTALESLGRNANSRRAVLRNSESGRFLRPWQTSDIFVPSSDREVLFSTGKS